MAKMTKIITAVIICRYCRVSCTPSFPQFITESKSERITEFGKHFNSYCKNKSGTFYGSQCRFMTPNTVA